MTIHLHGIFDECKNNINYVLLYFYCHLLWEFLNFVRCNLFSKMKTSLALVPFVHIYIEGPEQWTHSDPPLALPLAQRKRSKDHNTRNLNIHWIDTRSLVIGKGQRNGYKNVRCFLHRGWYRWYLISQKRLDHAYTYWKGKR